MFDLNRDRMSRARELFARVTFLGQPHDALTIVFECLGTDFIHRDFLNRVAGLGQPERPLANPAATRQLSRLFQYSSFRFTELISRLGQLNWMQCKFESKQGEKFESWSTFAALAIKDFHIDLSSLMDAVAPTILQAFQAFDAEGEQYLPGFADIQEPGSRRARRFRASLPVEVLGIVDQTNRWWPAVKDIRNVLTHREHHKIVFSDATVGVLFQFYTPEHVAMILDPHLFWQGGDNVVDFRLYSVAVLAELLVFLDELGIVLAAHLKLPVGGLVGSRRIGDFTYLLGPLKRLLAILEQPSK